MIDELKVYTHGNPGRHQVHLVQHVHQMLVRLLFTQVLDNRLTPCAERISSVEHVNNNVGRVEHLVQLTPDTPRGTLVVDGLSRERSGGMVGVIVFVDGIVDRADTVSGRFSRSAKLFERAEIEARTFSLSFRAESVREGLGLNNVRSLWVSCAALSWWRSIAPRTHDDLDSLPCHLASTHPPTNP